jgi:hypothetical protein
LVFSIVNEAKTVKASRVTKNKKWNVVKSNL